MIESHYWKEELGRIEKTLRPRKRPRRWSERAHCVVERDVMIGFFMVRRLIELYKVSSATRNFQLQAFSYAARGMHVHRMNGFDLYELYDLDKERSETKRPLYISNQFVHAYTSFVSRDKSRNWADIYVLSDYDRNSCIWRVPIEVIRGLFSIAARDYPREMHMVYNEAKGDYDVSTN